MIQHRKLDPFDNKRYWGHKVLFDNFMKDLQLDS